MPDIGVADFYADRSVLVTGATGFLGKVLIEKLLRSIPRLKRIYALIRPSKNQSAQDRWNKIIDSDLFDLIRKSSHDQGKSIFDKVIVINSDLMAPELGLSVQNERRLCDDVSVVFHCAATVKFDEHVKVAVRMNMRSTQRLLRLCHQMKCIDAFVHVSTAFCNCDRTYIVERVYPAHIHPQKLIDVVEWMNDEMLDALTPTLLGQKPNTYTLTKSLTESMLVEESNHLPITIVRPSIVTPIWKEPKPGWVDNYNGASGLMAITIKGLVRVMYGRLDEIPADIVPVDLVVNMLIVAGWHRGVMKDNSLPVMHCSSDRLNPVMWGDVIWWSQQNLFNHIPLSQLYREPSGKFTICPIEYQIRLFFDHVLPAYLIDGILFMLGRRRFMVRLYEKIFLVLDTFAYFYSNSWYHQSRMALLLNEQLSKEDRKTFFIDVREINWKNYVYDMNVGIRKTILKEDLSTVPEGFRVQFRRRLLYKAFRIGMWAFILRFLVRKTKVGPKLWQIMLGFINGTQRLLRRSNASISV